MKYWSSPSTMLRDVRKKCSKPSPYIHHNGAFSDSLLRPLRQRWKQTKPQMTIKNRYRLESLRRVEPKKASAEACRWLVCQQSSPLLLPSAPLGKERRKRRRRQNCCNRYKYNHNNYYDWKREARVHGQASFLLVLSRLIHSLECNQANPKSVIKMYCF